VLTLSTSRESEKSGVEEEIQEIFDGFWLMVKVQGWMVGEMLEGVHFDVVSALFLL